MDEPTQNNQLSEGQPPETPLERPGDMQPAQAEPERKFKLNRQFAAGFLGWYLVMGALYGILSSTDTVSNFAAWICVVQGVGLLVLFLARRQRSMAYGVLAAIGINFVLSLLLSLLFNAICFVPFFFPQSIF